MGTGAEVGGYGRSKVKGKTAGRSGLWDERGVAGGARWQGRGDAGPCMERGEVLIVDGRQCEGASHNMAWVVFSPGFGAVVGLVEFGVTI